ncbi:MAG: hypothetical protein AAB558_02395 [Patescibacteria group bacterium]
MSRLISIGLNRPGEPTTTDGGVLAAPTGIVSSPFEGSVLGKGFEVKRQTLEVVKLLLPGLDLKPYEASGMVGVAKLAMV